MGFSLKYETACAALCQPHTARDTGSPILPNTQSKDRQQSPNTTILISFVLIWAAEEYDDDNEYWAPSSQYQEQKAISTARCSIHPPPGDPIPIHSPDRLVVALVVFLFWANIVSKTI